MDRCPIVQRMKRACPILKPKKLASKLFNLECELTDILELLEKSTDYHIERETNNGMDNFSKIAAIETFLPDSKHYRKSLEDNCTNPLYHTEHPDFYKFKIIKISEKTIRFKNLFTVEPNELSVDDFIVLKVGERASLLLVNLAQNALLLSRCHTALAFCRIGLIIVRYLSSIGGGILWKSHQVLHFLLVVQAVEACALLASFDHLSCDLCLEVMESTVSEYWYYLNIFMAHACGLEEDNDDVFSDGEFTAGFGTICQRLQTSLELNNFVGDELKFKFSTVYFHLAANSIKNLGAPQPSPKETYFELCIKGFHGTKDPYMLAAAFYCRGCFDALMDSNSLFEKMRNLMRAEKKFRVALSLVTEDNFHSIPWQKLFEKTYLAAVLTQCRQLMICVDLINAKDLRNCMNNLYTLAKLSFPSISDDGFSSRTTTSALASVIFIFFADHVPCAPGVIEKDDMASFSIRKAECKSLAIRYLQHEPTLLLCSKVLCDLSKERLRCEHDLINDQSRLGFYTQRCLERLCFLCLPVISDLHSISRNEYLNCLGNISLSTNDINAGSFDREFDLLSQRERIAFRMNLKSSPAVLPLDSNENWVADFSPTLCLGKSESIISLDVIRESAIVIQGTLREQKKALLVPFEELVSLQRDKESAQETVTMSNLKTHSLINADDTETWIAFLRQCNLLRAVEKKLEYLSLDGTDCLSCWKNVIRDDLQILSRAMAKHVSSSSDDELDSAMANAHYVYDTLLSNVERNIGLKEFLSSLSTFYKNVNGNHHAPSLRPECKYGEVK